MNARSCFRRYITLAAFLLGALTSTVASANLAPNPSLETPDAQDPEQPAGWESDVWGGVNASFQYLSSGYEGQRSVRVEVTQASGEGDAKWWSSPFSVPGGGRYLVSDFFRSSAASELLVQALGASGQSDWFSVKVLPPGSSWTPVSGVVELPSWTVSVQLAHVLRTKGWLETDSFALAPDTVPFPTDGGPPTDTLAADLNLHVGPALVSVAFDDGWLSSYVHAVAIMNNLGLRGSHYIIAGWVDKPGYQSDYLTSEQLTELSLAGHEIGSHSLYHDNMTELSDSDLTANLVESKKILEQLGLRVAGFVPPGGAMNQKVLDGAKENYSYLRTVEAGLNFSPYDIYHLKCIVVLNTTPLAEIADWVQRASAEGGWLILLYHRFSPQAPAETYVTPTAFQAQMDYLIRVGAKVLPIGEVLNVWTRPDPPPPIETGRSLPPTTISTAKGCALTPAPPSPLAGPLLILFGLALCRLGKSRWRH
jgi:peptidoglycan/xylan/chitin deacetylase (PgdA/CDA1 family)